MAASQPSTQDQMPCRSTKKRRAKSAASPPATQDQTPCQSAKKEKPKLAASPPSIQTPCTPSCTPPTNLVPSSADTCPVVMSSIIQVLLMLLSLMTVCFQWCRKQCSSLMFGHLDRQAETTEPLETSTKVFLSMSCFASGLQCFRRMMISNAMGGFFHLYLPLILLMRSGDIETNPGPNSPESTVSDREFLKLARDIHPSYYTVVGVSLGIPYVHLDTILIEKLNNYPSAFMTVFMKWNVKQQPPNTNKREVLADTLRENDLGDLAEKLCNGRLLPNSTGGPSRSPESQTQPPPAESETNPLSPEQIERCANDFKFKYRSTLCKIRADPLDPASLVQFEDMYTNLVLEKEYGRKRQALDYNALLDLKVNGQFPKRLMVQGEAGAGKTTLCAKIAWDWIEKKYFKQFVWVLIVHLRDAEQYTLGQIAKSYLTKDNPATECQLAEYIRSNPDKVFIALDGLDEFSGKVVSESECQQSQTHPWPSQSRADSAQAHGSPPLTSDIRLEGILCSVELELCPVLVTSRPWKAVEIRSVKDLLKLYTFIHVEGFSRENLSVYIQKFFAEDDAKAEQLIQFTHENDVVSENMAHYPIYVAMLCLMWKLLDEQKLKEIKLLQTFSQIFKEMICFLKEHYAQKKFEKVGSPSLSAYLKEIDKRLEPIAKQAFTGLLKNTLVFRDNEFNSCPKSMEMACRVGILSQEDRIKSDSSSYANSHVQLPVFFPHKLFQEYMAGLYLASLYESDRSEFTRLIGDVVMPRKKEFRYLLYFTVSQNKNIAHCVMESMIQGYRPSPAGTGSDADRDFIVDVAFESQDPDAAALVKDRVSSQGMKLKIGRSMTAHTVAGYAFTRPPVVGLTVERDCGPTMSHDVVEMICSIPSLKTAIWYSVSFHDDMYAVLAEKGKESKVHTLSLDRVKSPTPASSHDLAEALCSMPNLNGLTLDRMDLTDEFCSTLKARSSSLKVQNLILAVVDQCSTPASSHNLAEALCSMPQLNDLTLCGMDLSDEFCSTLKARASSLKVQKLRLRKVTYPTPASSHDLAEALCSMPSLNDLTLDIVDLSNKLYSTLKAKALTIKGCFPQIRNGNFRFNGILQKDLNSFLHFLAARSSPFQFLSSSASMLPSHFPEHQLGNTHSLYQVPPSTRNVSGTNPVYQRYWAHSTCTSHVQPLGGSFHGNTPIPTSVSSERTRAVYQDAGTSTGSVLPVHANVYVHGFHTTSVCNPEYKEPYCNPSYHASLPGYAPSCIPQVSTYDQPTISTGFISQTQYQPFVPERTSSTTMAESRQDHYTQSHRASTSSSDPLCNPPVSGYHHPVMSRAHILGAPQQPMVLEQAIPSRPQSIQDHCSPPCHNSAANSTLLSNSPFSGYDQANISTGFFSSPQHQPLAPEEACSTTTAGSNQDHYPQPYQTPMTGYVPLPSASNPTCNMSGNFQSTMPLRHHSATQYQPSGQEGTASTNRPSMSHLSMSGRCQPIMLTGHQSATQYQPSGQEGTASTHRPSMSHLSMSGHFHPTLFTGHHSATQYQPSGQEGTASTNRPSMSHPTMSGHFHPTLFTGQQSATQYQPSGQEGTASTNSPAISYPTMSGSIQPNMPTIQQSTIPYHPVTHKRTDSSGRQGTSSQLSHLGNFLPPIHDAPSTARGQVFHGGSSSETVGQFSQTCGEGSSSWSRSHKRQAPSTQSRVPQEDPNIPEKQPKT